MNALPKVSTNNVIDFNGYSGKIIRGGLSKQEAKLNKDGTVDKRHCNKVAGVSSEVYAFRTEEEIKAMINAFNNKIENAPDENKRWIASRNKLMFLIGVNVGLRASDLVPLKWNFFYNEDGTFKEFYVLKTKKTKKFVKIFFNKTVKKAVENYVSDYPIENLDEYLFKSRVGGGCITEKSLGRIVKDTAAEINIPQNICSHSLRKTWAFTIWHEAEDKSKALVMLQQCLGHSDSMTTLRYIGIMDDEKKDMYESVEIGLDFI